MRGRERGGHGAGAHQCHFRETPPCPGLTPQWSDVRGFVLEGTDFTERGPGVCHISEDVPGGASPRPHPVVRLDSSRAALQREDWQVSPRRGSGRPKRH